MAQKKINYLSRDFESIKEDLIKFSNQYYPELADDFNDSSIASWFIDLVSAVGDDLSYSIDRQFQETNIDSANLRSTVMNLAKSNGLKVPGIKASICEVELSCVLPTDSTDISQPNWSYAPIVQRTSIVSAGNYDFELSENVNFKEQFNSDGYSNRTIVPYRNGNGQIIGYTVSKTTLVNNGTTKVYKKVLNSSDIKPFMEVVLPETNVMNVESIIFKETSEYAASPKIYEYYIDEEEYQTDEDAVVTHRYFECESLADQYLFLNETSNNESGDFVKMYSPYAYDDYSGKTSVTRYYRGKWTPIRNKFITEYTSNGYMKVIFGASNGHELVYDDTNMTSYGEYIASNLVNNDSLGVLPKEGWTMYVLYRIGGGVFTNLAPGSINKITRANIDWNEYLTEDGAARKRGNVITSLTVTNLSSAVGGKDAPSVDEIKNLIKYNMSAQNRAVTVKDYQAKLMQMPPRYGAPFRCSVAEVNNKIQVNAIGMDENGKLMSALPQVLANNIVEYMSHYKQINDYIEVKSGKVYNIGIGVDLFLDKNYNINDVMTNVINTIGDYFDVNGRQMGEDIFVGDLEKEVSLLDGVISLIDLRVYKIHGGEYSADVCPLPTYVEGSTCEPSIDRSFNVSGGATSEEIDLDAVDRVLYTDYDSMYEIRDKSVDIVVRCKTR